MTPPDTPEAIERLAEGLACCLHDDPVEDAEIHPAIVALRAYAQVLRQAEPVQRERAEALRLLRKAHSQAGNVMQTWYEGENEALAALGLRWPWDLDGEPGAQP